MKADIKLGNAAAIAIRALNESGYEAYVVGGFVRDSIMGRITNDSDVCTSASPNETENVFKDFKVIKTGIKHGTVTVIIDSEPIEITTFRTESEYTDGRHPDGVSFVKDVKEDLSRRDFTVNAIAYSPITGLIDPFGGLNDINVKVIRCVGDPVIRFTEDALRIFRAIRFSSVLGFKIDDETSKAIFCCKERLSLVSAERIRDELLKLLCGDNAYSVLCDYREIISYIIPELAQTFDYDQNNPHHEFDLYTHLIKTVTNLPRDPILRLTGLLHDIAKPTVASVDDDGISHYYDHARHSAEMAETILRRLKLSNAEVELAVTLIRHHDGVIEENESSVKRKLGKLGNECFYKLLDLQRSDNASQTSDTSFRLDHNSALRRIADKVIDDNDCIKVSSLDINGNDLIEMGLNGRQIGRSLSVLLDAVINGEVKNAKRDLIEYLNNSVKTVKGIKP